MTFIKNQALAWSQIREMFSHNETPNGPGSQLANTANVVEWLPKMLREYNIGTMLDAPCGDWNWMQHVDLGGVVYNGWDNEKHFIDANRKAFPQHNFWKANLLTTRTFPGVDLMLVRDFMIHLPNGYISLLLDKIKHSGSRYLLATNHYGAHNDHACDLNAGHDDRPGYYFRPVNLEVDPFNLVGRIDQIVEDEHHELVLFDLSRTK